MVKRLETKRVEVQDECLSSALKKGGTQSKYSVSSSSRVDIKQDQDR